MKLLLEKQSSHNVVNVRVLFVQTDKEYCREYSFDNINKAERN